MGIGRDIHPKGGIDFSKKPLKRLVTRAPEGFPEVVEILTQYEITKDDKGNITSYKEIPNQHLESPKYYEVDKDGIFVKELKGEELENYFDLVEKYNNLHSYRNYSYSDDEHETLQLSLGSFFVIDNFQEEGFNLL